MPQTRSSTRGEQTREALLQAAIEVFGRDGFHAASTRAIAQAAGANQALIGYHFGGKEGLYLAAFAHIVERMTANLLPITQNIALELESLEAGTADLPDKALLYLEQVMSSLVGQIGQVSAAGWPRLVVREQQDPTAAFDILYEHFYQPLLGTVTRLVGLLLDIDPTSEQARARAMMILSQAFFFLAARATTMRHMQWNTLGTRELDVIREQILDSLRSQFKV